MIVLILVSKLLGLVGIFIHHLLQRRHIRAIDTVSLVAVLEEIKGGDGICAKLKGQVGDGVNVEPGKDVVVRRKLGSVALEDGGDGLAGLAVGGVGLDGEVLVGEGEGDEVFAGGDGVDCHGGGADTG